MRTFAEAQKDLGLKKLARSYTFKKEVHFPKSGVTIPAGTTCDFYIPSKGTCRLYFQYGTDSAKSLRFENAYKYLSGFIKPPTPTTLQKWSDMGMCRTPSGEATEPDGYDRFGFPSWLLIMELI